MSDIIKWAAGGDIVPSATPPTATTWGEQRHVRQVDHAVTRAKVEIDGMVEVYVYGAEAALGLDDYRRERAMGDPERNALLSRYEVGFLAAIEKRLQQFGR